jgi:hypothetical protein
VLDALAALGDERVDLVAEKAEGHHRRDRHDEPQPRRHQGLADAVGQLIGLRGAFAGGDDVERFHHPFDRAEQAEHRGDDADDVQAVRLAIELGRVFLAGFFHGGFVVGVTKLAVLIALQASQDHLARQRIVARVFTALDSGGNIPLGDQVLQLIDESLWHQPLFADRNRVLDAKTQGHDRHQNDDDADITAGLDRIHEGPLLDDLRAGPLAAGRRAADRRRRLDDRFQRGVLFILGRDQRDQAGLREQIAQRA